MVEKGTCRALFIWCSSLILDLGTILIPVPILVLDPTLVLAPDLVSGSDSGSEENISLLKTEDGFYKTVGSVFLESMIVITGSCSLSILADSLAQCLPCIYRFS